MNKTLKKVVIIMAALGITGGMLGGLTGCDSSGGIQDGGERGGSVSYQNSNAPKKIKSEDLNYFSVESSFTSLANEHDYNYVYGYASKVQDGVLVALRYEVSYSNSSSEEGYSKIALVNGDVLKDLNKIVKDYDFARFNGGSHYVNGLPENYGGSADIRYDSKEYITFDDNQGPIISAEASAEIVKVLSKYIKEKAIVIGDANDIKAITYLEDRGKNNYSYQHLEGDKLVTEQMFKDSDTVYHHEYKVEEDAKDKVINWVKENAMLTWAGLYEYDWDIYRDYAESVTFTMNDGKEYVIKECMRKPKNLTAGIFDIHMYFNELANKENEIK